MLYFKNHETIRCQHNSKAVDRNAQALARVGVHARLLGRLHVTVLEGRAVSCNPVSPGNRALICEHPGTIKPF